MKTLILLTALLSLPAFAREGGGSSVGTGNPAAKLCLDIGGKLERYQNHLGEGANCAVEEWKLYQEMSKLNLVKPIHCHPNMPCMPNPAARNCADIGGQYRSVETPEGMDGECVVEEWALWGVFHPQR